MLQSFDYLDEVLATQHRHEASTLPAYYASELLEGLSYQPDQATEALARAMRGCAALGMPVALNFRRTYCCYEGQVNEDWQLTPLASHFLVINCDPSHPAVAGAQLHILRKYRSL